MTATPKQIGMIHGLKKAAGLAEDDYRAVLQREAGVASAKLLTVTSASRVIERLRVLSGQAAPQQGAPARGQATGAMPLAGPYAAKLRALWLTGWNLGVVKDRTDAGLAAFMTRQTGIDHPNWLRNPYQATRVIEGLKAWIGREAGLAWPDDGDIHAVKVAVVEAAWRRAIASGACKVLHTPDADLTGYGEAVARRPNRTLARIDLLTDAELDRVASAIGARIRKHGGR